MTVGSSITWHCTLGFFFFKKAYICIHILEGSGFRKETRVVKVTHFTRVFALTKEPQRTRPWPLAGKTP